MRDDLPPDRRPSAGLRAVPSSFIDAVMLIAAEDCSRMPAAAPSLATPPSRPGSRVAQPWPCGLSNLGDPLLATRTRRTSLLFV